LKAWKAR